MNPQIIFNFSLVLLTVGIILLIKGIFIIGFTSLIIAIASSMIWLMSGFFGKFEYSTTNNKLEDEKDDDGKGVLKPF